MERTYPATPVLVRYHCDDCGEEVLPTGKMDYDVTSDKPPRFYHACQGCERIYSFLEKYPTIRWQTTPE